MKHKPADLAKVLREEGLTVVKSLEKLKRGHMGTLPISVQERLPTLKVRRGTHCGGCGFRAASFVACGDPERQTALYRCVICHAYFRGPFPLPLAAPDAIAPDDHEPGDFW